MSGASLFALLRTQIPQLSIDSFCVAGSSSFEALADYSARKILVGRPHKRWPSEMEFESDDHKLCLWLRVEKEQEDSPRHSRGRRGRAVETERAAWI